MHWLQRNVERRHGDEHLIEAPKDVVLAGGARVLQLEQKKGGVAEAACDFNECESLQETTTNKNFP